MDWFEMNTSAKLAIIMENRAVFPNVGATEHTWSLFQKSTKVIVCGRQFKKSISDCSFHVSNVCALRR